MTHQTYVFNAELVGFQGVRRTITVRDDLTLVDLHYALQSAFGWDDDHLYSFCWTARFGRPRTSSTCIPTTPPRSIRPAGARADGRALARCIERVGAAPPQHDEGASERENAPAPPPHADVALGEQEEEDAA